MGEQRAGKRADPMAVKRVGWVAELKAVRKVG